MTSKRTAMMTAPAAFRRPVRTAHVPLALEGYPDEIGATMRTNLTMREYEELAADWRVSLRRLIVDWSLADTAGEPVALDDTMSGATDEELMALLRSYYNQLQQRVTLPKLSETPVTTSG